MNKQLLAPTHPTHLNPAVELKQAQDAATVCCDMCPHPLDQHDAIAPAVLHRDLGGCPEPRLHL